MSASSEETVSVASIPIDGMLLIARHHESEWNKEGMWTGAKDVHLTPLGKEMSFDMGLQVREFDIQQAVCSTQHRSCETLQEMLRAMRQEDVPILKSASINERDYGDLTGKHKAEIRALMGEEAYMHLHRDFTYPIPHGESLKTVYERAVPFYLETILPMLREGKNVLMVSHGNTIRSLIKYIESISDKDISDVEMLFGTILMYRVDAEGRQVSREERFADIEPTHRH